MFDFTSKDINKFKVLGVLSLILFFIILFTFGVRYYFSKTIVNDWESISAEKKKQIDADCLNIFYNYQNQTAQFSYSLIRNKKLGAAFSNQNTKKAYESLYENENIDFYNVEMYNSRFELFLFSGRQVNPETRELKKALDGERYSAVKEVGLYTYIVVFDPIKSESGTPEGVLVVSRLLDINYEIQNRFFRNTGIKSEIFDKHHIEVDFDFKPPVPTTTMVDTAAGEFSQINLKDINSNYIGRIIMPNLDQSSYLLSSIKYFDNIIGFMAFVLNLVLLYWILFVSLRAESTALKIIIATASLFISRYFWLLIDFPGRIITESGSDIFSPVHYASGIGLEMTKSIGELFITSIVFMAASIYAIINIIKFYRSELKNPNLLWINILAVLGAVLVSVITVHFYGVIVQSLIYDSTIKFIDKSDIFSTSQPELIITTLIILCFSISMFLVLACSGLVAVKYLNPYLNQNKFIRKNSALIIFAGFILINVIISLIPETAIEFSLKLNLRLLIFALAGLFTFFIQKQLINREYTFINSVNFSLILLACVIFVPAVLLNKITAQENRYLEKAAKEVSQQSSDKISFLISSTLEDISDEDQLKSDIKDKNKFSKLAFNIWAKSKFYDEDLNSAVFVLDTAKRLISDFNINSNDLLSDSVISFSLRSLKSKKPHVIEEESDEEEDEEVSDEEQPDMEIVSNTFRIAEGGDIYQNKEMKFYCGILPVEKPGLKKNDLVGYVVIAAGYDAKNFLAQTNLSIFKNFTRDNILNKLTSTPVITEFSEGELVGSSNKDVSKAFVKSLDAFRESVVDKVDKSSLRYDEFEGEIYKSYYILVENKPENSPASEKIYIVSVKVNDFGLSTFFFFRYLLFVVFIYLIILIVYFIYRSVSYLTDTEGVRIIKFGFREKIFVSFLLASVIPIIILAIYTREFVKDKNEQFYKSQLISDLRIVEQYIKNKAFATPPFRPSRSLKQEANPYADLFTKGFSESDKNFNFYVKTKLVSTTSEQLYKSDLLDTRISGSAFYNIALQKKDYFSENQQIGNFTFIVGYKPIYDSFNNLLGIISTQTVFKQNEINQELTESLVYILGPYFTAVIILIFIVNLLSYRISNPILKLQKATEQLSKGNIDVQVKSDSTDEIGQLVKSFNRMIKELKRSRAELKKAEREGAWRDIARQVAHEIKNPLTPMKLAMQHLYYAYTRGSKDFKSVIQNTNKLIIDQIETLNKIATEFSNFAKLPSRNYELLDINDIVKDAANLMDLKGKIKIKLDTSKEGRMIMGDKDELRRALINIIKNSMQAIEEKESGEKGLINIEGIRNNGIYSVTIKDNGIGMDMETQQQLFEPYFSTKSSGMGLGLVITKKILDDMKAKIFVKSKVGDGTEVEIKFKIVDGMKFTT